MATKTKQPKKTSPSSSAMEATVYNAKGEQAGTVTLPEAIFALPWNADLVHQVVVGMRANARQPVAHAKTRGEVRGGGKKPWQQKGTGRARHGSSRSPIWKGGGVTHGPRNDKNYAVKINQKMRQKALLVTLSRKLKDNEIIFIDSLELQTPKAKDARAFIQGLSNAGFPLKQKNAALVALPERHLPTMKSFGNFGNVAIEETRNLNPVSVLSAKYLVITNPQEAFDIIAKKQVMKVIKHEQQSSHMNVGHSEKKTKVSSSHSLANS